MNTILLLDLENTIIWDWENPRLMCSQFPILKEWVMDKLGHNTRVGVLSWAIWDKHDLEIFNEDGIRKDIELTHHFEFSDELIFTLGNCIEIFSKRNKMPFLNQTDFFDFVKKQQMVEALWLDDFNQPNTRVILLDDTVPNIIMHRTDVENNSLELVDPWTIIKRDMI